MVSLHERAKDLFLAALDRPPADRRRFIAEACGTDLALFAEVESLLKFHEETGGTDNTGRPKWGQTPGSDPRSAAGSAARGDDDAGGHTFNPGDVFAGRYRMVTRIGRGGMGDVWRADDLVLETPVALKLIQSTGLQARAHIINEVRLSRQITHPSVCRVFDVGEDEGLVFFTMELVNGEDLATLLRRAGRLPAERVLDIARQLCSGLAAAHAVGVLHRDLKPANVMIDNRGRVLITDFGIAIPRENATPNALMGTPGYMAPEQITPGATLTECTDIYALGIILYELVVGQHPFNNRLSRATEPPAPSAKVPDIDPRLERLILQALKEDPRARPQSAATMAASLADVSVEQPIARRWWYASVAVAAIMVLAAIIVAFITPRAGGSLTEQDAIVLADFANTTGDPVFDGALKVALAVALEQSPFLKVFPEERMRDTLQLMGKPADAPITRTVAREIAQREQVKALLAGSIARLGRNYVVAVEAVNASTGDVMAREQVEAGSKEDVLASLGRAAASLRSRLGESLASIQKFDVPLARATTGSLDALHHYSLALDNGAVNPRLDAIPHLQRAIELDPNFALAMALLATVYSNTGQTSLAPDYARRAFDLRDRVSERERFFIAYRYYRDAVQNWAEALALSRTWTATYPREAFAFNSLGQSLQRFGQYEESLEPLRQSMRLDPTFEAPYANLAQSLLSLGRFDEMGEVLRQASELKLNSFPIRRMNYLLGLVRGDTATMARMLQASVGVGQTNAAWGWQGHAFAAQGQMRLAHEQFETGVKVALQNGFREVAGQLTIEDAEVDAITGKCAEAQREVVAGLELSRDNYSLERASRTLAVCGREAEALVLLSELRQRFPDATLTNRIAVPLVEAVIAGRHGDDRRVIEILDPVSPYDRASRSEFWPEYLRGEALLRLDDAEAAAAQFQSILDHYGEYPTGTLFPLARLGLARAKALAGDTNAARRYYEEFLTRWANADQDLTALSEARQELARLK